ncbi:Golgi SNAP receptor complex member 2-like [Artemia franciscana]|uniref:Uncharacterized protein n=1 Tax=Artemia franciscana TaxID=6661 RepID=A0AA88HUT7_ARTSF|nr:hypothetical protein QYM36_011255 [Artemia franciscana]
MNFEDFAQKFEVLYMELRGSVALPELPVTHLISQKMSELRRLYDRMDIAASNTPNRFAVKEKTRKYWMNLMSLEGEIKERKRQQEKTSVLKESSLARRKPEEVKINVDAELEYRQSAGRTRSSLDSMIEASEAMISILRTQKDSIKGIKRRVLDAANSIGMGSTVIRLIEKRSDQDMTIFFVGCIFLLVLLILLIIYI